MEPTVPVDYQNPTHCVGQVQSRHRHDIAEILLTVALNTITITPQIHVLSGQDSRLIDPLTYYHFFLFYTFPHWYNWNIAESGIKHHQANIVFFKIMYEIMIEKQKSSLIYCAQHLSEITFIRNTHRQKIGKPNY